MQNLPKNLAQILVNAKFQAITTGRSGAGVYLATNLPEYDNAYLKIASPKKGINLKHEKDVLNWLKTKLRVPKVVCFEQDNEFEYLLISAVEGNDVSVFTAENPGNIELMKLAATLAEELRRIHEIPITDCHFPQNLSIKFKLARERIERGLIDETDFLAKNQGKTAGEIYQGLIERNMDDEDLVFTHGDFCLPNIIIKNTKVSGLIDWERGGIADRYQDIALFFRSFAFNTRMSLNIEKVFCHHYGIKRLDKNKIEFYINLDELF
jgi:aminoglycoside phosphotransferase